VQDILNSQVCLPLCQKPTNPALTMPSSWKEYSVFRLSLTRCLVSRCFLLSEPTEDEPSIGFRSRVQTTDPTAQQHETFQRGGKRMDD